MYVITGGAGFIGSNIAAALEDGAPTSSSATGSAQATQSGVTSPNAVSTISSRRPRSPNSSRASAERFAASCIWAAFRPPPRPTSIWSSAPICASRSISGTYCAEQGIPLIYASSASTYGDGRSGFDDRSDADYLSRLRPLSPYAWSKHVFDRWVARAIETGASAPPRWAGLKFFNVYGPNEYHKGSQRSVAVQLHEQIREHGRVRLFRSDNAKYPDGGQLRDFVWVGDCVNAALWALAHPSATSGIYNVGSGVARARSSTWRQSCSGKSGLSRTLNISICRATCRTSTNIIRVQTWKSCAPPDSPSRQRCSRTASGVMCATFSRPTIRSAEPGTRASRDDRLPSGRPL